MILGIDTSASQCAAALVEPEGHLLAARAERMERGHADRLFPLIEAVLGEAGARFADLSGVAVCTGPGSFTGIRVGVAAARGLALGTGRPAHGIDRFRALLAARGTEGPAAVALAGPRETAYLACFSAGREPLGKPRQIARAALEEEARAGALRLGDGWPGADPSRGLPDPADFAAALADPALAALFHCPPAPAYLRGPNADLPREAPPRILDA